MTPRPFFRPAELVGAVVLGEPAGALVAVVDLGGEVVVLLAVALGVVGLDLEDGERLGGGRAVGRLPTRWRTGRPRRGATVVVRVAGAAESPSTKSLLAPIRETPQMPMTSASTRKPATMPRASFDSSLVSGSAGTRGAGASSAALGRARCGVGAELGDLVDGPPREAADPLADRAERAGDGGAGRGRHRGRSAAGPSPARCRRASSRSAVVPDDRSFRATGGARRSQSGVVRRRPVPSCVVARVVRRGAACRRRRSRMPGARAVPPGRGRRRRRRRGTVAHRSAGVTGGSGRRGRGMPCRCPRRGGSAAAPAAPTAAPRLPAVDDRRHRRRLAARPLAAAPADRGPAPPASGHGRAVASGDAARGRGERAVRAADDLARGPRGDLPRVVARARGALVVVEGQPADGVEVARDAGGDLGRGGHATGDAGCRAEAGATGAERPQAGEAGVGEGDDTHGVASGGVLGLGAVLAGAHGGGLEAAQPDVAVGGAQHVLGLEVEVVHARAGGRTRGPRRPHR